MIDDMAVYIANLGKYKWPFKKKRWNEKFERNALYKIVKLC